MFISYLLNLKQWLLFIILNETNLKSLIFSYLISFWLCLSSKKSFLIILHFLWRCIKNHVKKYTKNKNPKIICGYTYKECSNYCTIVLISHSSKVMLKILQATFQQYLNQELPDVRVGFRKGRGTKYQTVNICWIIEKASEFQKYIYFWLKSQHSKN